ncbi:hypothetical protein ACFWP3_29570 [Streptomyces sp. NPDC058525]|uniref:hypothetical protein n=1 Tax=Streptomyces sp. NPDC058525 TaxID=3346538 RepID=UPI00365DBDC8
MRSRGAANRAALGLTGFILCITAASWARWGTVGSPPHLDLTPVRDRLSGHPTAALTVLGCLGLLLGMALLKAQFRGRVPRRLPLTSPRCSLDSRALRRAARTGCTAVPGVVRARCRLNGSVKRPELTLILHLDCRARPDDVLTAIGTSVLPSLAALLAPQPLNTRILLRVQRPRRVKAA